MLLPVVMAGGSGTRLWPLSRTLYPKQFLSLNSRLTMLQETLRRLDKIERGFEAFDKKIDSMAQAIAKLRELESQ